MSDSEKLFQVSGLKRNFTLPGDTLPILKGVDFTFHKGEMAFVVGRSGSGKSTFLHILGGMDKPSEGKVLFEGQDLTKLNEKDLARIRNLRLGFVFQFYHLLPELTVYENVALPMMIAGKKDHLWVREVLRRVKLLSRQTHLPSELSGGEKQRVALARALANRPAVVLCDEPTGNLDDETAESVFGLMQDLNRKEGQAFLVVTHDENLAWRYPNHVYRLHEGILNREQRVAPSVPPEPGFRRSENSH